MKIRSLFLPHPLTHKSAFLLRWQSILIYILLFVALQINLKYYNRNYPQILGTTTNISIQEIISGTNQERSKYGLSILKENPALDIAADNKAKNMFTENYWAHYSPSGKDPWGFIKSTGYRFTYAGENLARNFTNSNDVVLAWMNSPSHKENILNSHYQEIGIAVEDGILNGQKTTLVVQMFGTPVNFISQIVPTKDNPAPIAQVPPEINTQTANNNPETVVASAQTSNPILSIKSNDIYKDISLLMVSGISILLLIEFLILKSRGVFRVKSHHFAHISLLSMTATIIISSPIGEISQSAASIISK